jgi:hypothetical protein
VSNQPPPTAAFTVDCTNPVLTGVYNLNQPLNSTNSVTLSVNVTTAGSYFITTNTVNGISFQDSGFFNTTGVQNLVLYGYGIPQQSGAFAYNVQYNGINGCFFPVSISPIPISTFVFNGAPGNCQFTAAGSYTAGVPLSGNNVIGINVNVTTAGAYTIFTNTVGGFSFLGSGVFTSTGVQTIFITGSGTPTAAGLYTFTPQGNGTTSTCQLSIQVN